MIHNTTQLKDLIKNFSKKNSIKVEILMRIYMVERLLERIEKSKYQDRFIIKGGILVASLIGISLRSTMDLDTTVKSINLDISDIRKVLEEIVSINIGDGVSFQIKNIYHIMDEVEYPGIRISMFAFLERMRIPLKLDISTNDIITPREVRYQYPLLLENRKIDVWAYTLETILAEKLETIIRRSITNTRMRDFYDIYVLSNIYEEQIDTNVLSKAIYATSCKRGSDKLLKDKMTILQDIRDSDDMKKLWKNYQLKYPYAKNILWKDTMFSIGKLFKLIEANN